MATEWRIEAADQAARERKVGAAFLDDPMFSQPLQGLDLPEDAAREAALAVACMSLDHTCRARTGPKPRRCRDPWHEKDRERLRERLDFLGLLPQTPAEAAPEPKPKPKPKPKPGQPTRTVLPSSWMDWAACRGMPLDLFYGHEHDRGQAVAQREAAAKAVCAVCPVTAECLDWAIARDEKGVWGGIGEEERKVLRRKVLRRASNARAAAQAQDEPAEEAS